MSSDDIDKQALGRLSLSELQELARERDLETDCSSDPDESQEYVLYSRILDDIRMRKKAVTNAPKLAGLQDVIAALDAAQSPYFCVGSLPLDASSPITIVVASETVTSENASPTYTPVQIPLKHDVGIQPLIDASKQASFGRGGEDVLDPSYRRALVLHPDRIAIMPAGSLEPHAMGIVEAIRESLVSSSDGGANPRRIVAVLDKLNIYSEGDFFKGHVDTPSSPNMFGTLLINLPVAHDGGQLIVRAPETTRKNRKGGFVKRGDGESSRDQYMTDWGKGTGIDWIAFFSDCEHEVLPVTHGNRVTLSYTLSFADPIKEAEEDHPVDIEALAGSKDLARQRLISALKTPGVWTKDRPRLCFYLKHKYPVDCEDPGLWSVKSQLKGRDAVLYHALQTVGAKITLHLVFFTPHENYDYDEGLVAINILPAGAGIEDPRRPSRPLPLTGLHETMESTMARSPEEMGLVEVPGDPELFVKLSYVIHHDGSDCSDEVIYGSMCLIATLAGEKSIVVA